MSTNYTEEEQVTINLLEQHVNAELRGDLATTTSTMTDAPHLLNIPNMMGGDDYAGVKRFYENHLVGKFFPPDVEMHRISLTVGKKVEVGLVVIVGVKDKKMAHEHIYWDQASVLNQVGLLDSKDLPICGSESAQKLLQFKEK